MTNNTPTPAQALGEVMALKDRHKTIMPGRRAEAAQQFIYAAADLIEQHGQHFAGLEAEVERARETLAKALDADGVNDESLFTLAARASNALYWRSHNMQEAKTRAVAAESRAEAAEARCAELDRLSAAISRDCNDCANQRNAANARAREAEGLLLEVERSAWGTMAPSDLKPTPLLERIAAFLAENGETK